MNDYFQFPKKKKQTKQRKFSQSLNLSSTGFPSNLMANRARFK